MTPKRLRLSQGHLQLLATCPPQFQRRYLEQWDNLPSPAQQARLDWGKQFHRLLQQWQLGLPLDPLLQDNPEMAQTLSALLEACPRLSQPPPEQQRAAEHSRTLAEADVLLTVVYDLLILEPQRAEILDWKTYPLPEKKPQQIIQNWQTKLYLYVLAETTPYPPEEISMTYWFVKLPQRPQSLTIEYSQAQHQQARRELTQLLAQLQHWLGQWHSQKIDFPHSAQCHDCPYRSQFVTPEAKVLQSFLALTTTGNGDGAGDKS
ncbi:PD-(D/E)XK nuclease family protein [Synechocystis sp. LKSZ1]|uniref:PD-(D/E)XK nuclease family protein n=1 Tax=Synechocystis sp. LKSZ1 TaxID=3144951 RepID=UPI00336C1031